MTTLNTVAEIDLEIARLQAVRAQALKDAKENEDRQCATERASFDAVVCNFFEAYAWTDESRTGTSESVDVAEIVTDHEHFFLIVRGENDVTVKMETCPGPVTFARHYSRVRM